MKDVPPAGDPQALGLDMKAPYIFSSLLFLFISSANAQVPDKLIGSWTLQVENLQHKVVTTLIIHFIEDEAQSCLGGNWKEIVVDSYKTSDLKFFPVNEPLSYELEGNKISIGRNEICDAYLQLRGELKESKMVGEYVAFGWGSRKLGYFSLKRGGL